MRGLGVARPGAIAAGTAGVLALVVVAVVECAAWRASRQEYPRHLAPGPAAGEDVVLVLGYPARRDGTPGILQRWRTRIARRSAPPGALFVFTGGAVHAEAVEADVMAGYARNLGVPASRIVRERAATSTRENLSHALPWLRGARSIRIASNTFHARRARAYLRELDPRLHARLGRTRDHRPFELGPLGVILTVYDAVAAAVSSHRDPAEG